MNAGSCPVVNWCVRCCHAITPVTGGWGHVSDDDWAGPDGECACTWSLTPCRPPRSPVNRRVLRSVAVQSTFRFSSGRNTPA
jgi:hypothetical protein